MRIIIIGCGRVGADLASTLESEGHEVAVVEKDRVALTHLPEGFQGRIILGTGIDDAVLRRAGIETADAVVAVTNYDNTNVVAAQIAKEKYKVRTVLARTFDPRLQDIYREFGLETICPTVMTVKLLRDTLEAKASGKGA